MGKVSLISVILLITTSCNSNKEEITSDILNQVLSQYPMYVKLSPSGNKILLKNRRANSFELVVTDTSLSDVRSIDVSDYSQLSLTWHPNNRVIIFQEFNKKTRSFDLFGVDLSRSKRFPVGLPSSTNAIPPLRWSSDGRYLAYHSTINSKGTLHIFDFEKRKPYKSYTNVSSHSDFRWLDDHTILFFENPNRPEIWEVNLLTNNSQTYSLSILNEIESFSVANDRVLIVGRESNEEYFQCYELNLKDEIITRLTNTDYNISACQYSINDSTIFYNQNENGIDRLYCTDSTANSYLIDSLFSQGSVFLEMEQENKILFSYHSIHLPPVLIEFDKKQLRFKTVYENENERLLWVEKPRFIEIASEDSTLNTKGFLWQSSSGKKKSIIYIHGGPHLQSRPLWNIQTKVLCDNGFNLLSINYKGSSGYSKKYAQQYDMQEQILNIVSTVEYLTKEFYIDEKDIILMGSSYGGKLALESCSYLKKIGGVVLISGALPGATRKRLNLEDIEISGHYGELDPLAVKARRFFKENGLYSSDLDNLVVFEDEGHLFHRSSSWACVYETIINEFSGEETSLKGNQL